MMMHLRRSASMLVCALASATCGLAYGGLINGSFDGWGDPTRPNGWERVNFAPLSEAPGFGGIGSAMLLEPGGSESNASVNQPVFAPAATAFTASFEFIQSAGSGRGVNFELRQPDTLGLIVLRVQDDGGDLNDLDLFAGPPGSGPGWTTVGDKSVIDGRRYRLTISGDLWEAGSLGSYDLLLEDVDLAQTVIDAPGLQLFFRPNGQAVTENTEIGGFQFNTGRSASAYTVDNAVFLAVPEPASLSLLSIVAAGVVGVAKRRR